MEKTKFSLVLCTVGEFVYVENLLNSLVRQNYKKFEVILIDQNQDDRLYCLIDKFSKSLSIVYVKSDIGLSLARNVGISYASGDVISFPDDDCIYPENLLLNVSKEIENKNISGLVIRAENSVLGGRVLHANDESQFLNRYNCLTLVHSISLFLKKEVIDVVGDFDTNLGLGAKTIYQGQEDRDYPIRALNLGFKLFYNRDITVLHPWDDPKIDQQKNLIERAFKGASAEIYLLNKHGYPLYYKCFRLLRKIAAIAYFAIIKRNSYKMYCSISGLKGMVCSFGSRP